MAGKLTNAAMVRFGSDEAFHTAGRLTSRPAMSSSTNARRWTTGVLRELQVRSSCFSRDRNLQRAD
jgi:hypothetical protein